MPETYECPDRVEPLQGCLDMKMVRDAISVLRDIRSVVNEFLTAEGQPTIDDISVPELDLDPCPLSAQLLKTIGDYVATLVAAGRVVKRVVDGAGVAWTLEEMTGNISKLSECGAFWSSWDEVYSCLEFTDGDKLRRIRAFGPDQEMPFVMDAAIWNQFWISINCMLWPGSPCFPDCDCPVCEKGPAPTWMCVSWRFKGDITDCLTKYPGGNIPCDDDCWGWTDKFYSPSWLCTFDVPCADDPSWYVAQHSGSEYKKGYVVSSYDSEEDCEYWCKPWPYYCTKGNERIVFYDDCPGQVVPKDFPDNDCLEWEATPGMFNWDWDCESCNVWWVLGDKIYCGFGFFGFMVEALNGGGWDTLALCQENCPPGLP